MRYFPSAPGSRARLRRAFSTTLVVPMLVGIVSIPIVYTVAPAALSGTSLASDTDDLRDKQKDVRHQIKNAEDEAEESSSRVATANAALASSKAKLSGAKTDLASVRTQLYAARAQDSLMKARLVAAEERLVQAQADVVTGKQALEDQRAIVKDLVIELYQQGDPTLVSLSGYFGAQTPSDLIRHEEYADSATSKQKGIFDDLTAAEVLLRAREEEVASARDDVSDRRAEAAANLTAMQELTDQAEAAKREVVGLIASNKSNQQAARTARQHDLQMLRDLKNEEAKVKRQILAAIAAAAAAAPAAGDGDSAGYTGQSDGFLSYPVNGSVTSPFGYRIHPIYGYYGLHDGTDFGAGCGTPMHAVADGTVISSYYSSVYGNRLYVNLGQVNGHNLTANYNHATSYTVGVGDRVKRGQVVGYVGSTGWSTGCHLHFTVLQDGDPVDPMGYM